MSQLIKDRVKQGRDAYRRHAWHEAFDSLREADSETTVSPQDLKILAESAWFAGDPGAASEARSGRTPDFSSRATNVARPKRLWNLPMII